MKKMILAFASLLALAMVAAAQADSVQLGFIDTNDCGRAQSEISLLSKAAVQVDASCSTYQPGAFVSNSGEAYDYRLYTTVTVAGTLASGSVIQLANIDTNNPAYAQSEVQLLNSDTAQAVVTATLLGPSSFPANNGQVYAYRITTTVTVK
jgi:hypothetical protein